MHTTDREVLVAEAVLDMATRTYGYDAPDLLHDLTSYVVSLVGVRAAGATVLNAAGQVDYLTASDEVCRRLVELQLALDEGPCLDSTRAGATLAPLALGPGSPGLRRWPRFAPEALRAGITGVAAVPLRVGAHTVGSVNLLGDGSAVPSAPDLRLAQVLADAAGAWLQYRLLLRSRDEVVEQLQNALRTRVVIEQAKGALAARLGIGVEEAFARLRAHARARQEKLHDLAVRVARGAVPAELRVPVRRAGP
ncbi:ANTAR domain-containing protein [Streptomyces sp. NPDC004111]|uniref:ANTAR domain-containing protein n=1 Tax=Streptomyces sp. NPDC004111 TaxID=3364690 RepID=UPI0036899433